MTNYNFTCLFNQPINISNHVVSYSPHFNEPCIVQAYYDFTFQPKEIAFYNRTEQELQDSDNDMIVAVWRVKQLH